MLSYAAYFTTTSPDLHALVCVQQSPKLWSRRPQAVFEAHLAELAHHFTKAASLLGTERAIDYSIRAGESANAVFAYEDAVEQLKTALEMMEGSSVARESRADLMVRLGNIAVITDRALAVECFDRALQIYRGLGRKESLADVHFSPRCRALHGLAGVGYSAAHPSISERRKNS